ncbi:MAG TPA: hypothetical protein VED01_11310 [Burkholderiales bacterium]|nr:hypothetical protein [Burkholderiales bacterium]
MDTVKLRNGGQWEFRCERSAGRACWRWRHRDADGTVPSDFGERFPSLHAAIDDAVRNGFDYAPRAQSTARRCD